MATLLLKYLAYAFILVIYGIFAWSGKAPVDGFIATLIGVLGILGGTHAYTAATGAMAAALKSAQVPPSAPTTVTRLP